MLRLGSYSSQLAFRVRPVLGDHLVGKSPEGSRQLGGETTELRGSW